MLFPIIAPATVVAATWDPARAATAGVALSNGNRTASKTADGANWVTARSNTSKTAGKWYFEFNPPVGGVPDNNSGVGLCDPSQPSFSSTSFPGSDQHAWIWYSGGGWWTQGANQETLAGGSGAIGWGGGDVISFALDMDAGKIYVGKNNTWSNSANPDAGTGNVFSGNVLGNTIFICVNLGFAAGLTYTNTLNAGSVPFVNNPPNISTFKRGFFV